MLPLAAVMNATQSNQMTSSMLDNITSTPLLIDKQPHMTKFMLVLYGVIFIVGFFGNSLVLYVVLKHKTMQTITNRFIACLSVSDLLLCIFAIPFTPINALGKSWSYGVLLCKLVPVILLISVFVSTLTSVMIAVDRYMVIVHPYAKRMTGKIQVAIVISIWLLAASTSVPIGLYTTLDESTYETSYDCHERWPNNKAAEIYTWLIFTLQVVIPAIIITLCYTAVGLSLRQRTKKRWANGSSNNDHAGKQEMLEMQRNRRINRMLIAMIVIFIICWLPLDLIHVAAKYLTPENFLIAFLFCHILAMSSVMYNPFLYGWLNENFNKHFRELGKKVTSCCRKKSTNLSSSDPDDIVSSSPTRNLTLSMEDGNHTLLSGNTPNSEPEETASEESQAMLSGSNGYHTVYS